MELRKIAHIRNAYKEKFGIPRQSGMTEMVSQIVFERDYRDANALRGLEGFSHLWLIWGFSANKPAKGEWQPTVRPPRLGGNVSIGVFATRSPFRPNPLGLSCVELVSVDNLELVVKGADLADGTPIYDIKPYVSYADSYPDAVCGFAQEAPKKHLKVVIPKDLDISAETRKALEEVLALDPRPAYQDNPAKEYAMTFEGADVVFRADADTVTVIAYRTAD